MLSCFSLVIIVPVIFYYNLDSLNKDIGGVDVENRKIFENLLNENVTYKNYPALLACGIEYRKLQIKN